LYLLLCKVKDQAELRKVQSGETALKELINKQKSAESSSASTAFKFVNGTRYGKEFVHYLLTDQREALVSLQAEAEKRLTLYSKANRRGWNGDTRTCRYSTWLLLKMTLYVSKFSIVEEFPLNLQNLRQVGELERSDCIVLFRLTR
jgi:hypothetical protein